MASVGERVKHLRKTNRYSQKEFAEKIGLGGGKMAISLIETGKRGLSLNVAQTIARLFQTSLDWLYNGEEDMRILQSSKNQMLDPIEQALLDYFRGLTEENKMKLMQDIRKILADQQEMRANKINDKGG